MEKCPQRLWRKIGLERNFLQQRSQSESLSDLDKYQENYRSSQSRVLDSESPLINQDHQLIYQSLKRSIHEGQHYSHESINVIQQPETIIENYVFSVIQSKFQPIKDTSMKEKQQTKIVHNIKQGNKLSWIQKQQGSQYQYLSGQVYDIELISFDRCLTMNSELIHRSDKKQALGHRNKKYSHDLDVSNFKPVQSSEDILRGASIQDSLSHNSDRVEQKCSSKQNYSKFRQMKQIEVIQCDELVSISFHEYHRLQKAYLLLSQMVDKKIPQLRLMVEQFKQFIANERIKMQSQLHTFKTYLQTFIIDHFKKALFQYADQIQYLYSQNQGLIQKLQFKQSQLQTTQNELQCMTRKLNHCQQSQTITNVYEHDLFITQQNQLNKLYQKMEQIQDLQLKNQSLTARISQLQLQIQHYKQKQQKYQSIIGDKDSKISQIQSQLHQSTQNKQQIEQKYIQQNKAYHLKLQNQFNDKLNYKTNQLLLLMEKTSHHYEQVIQQIFKYINLSERENILKKINIQKQLSVNKILEKIKTKKINKNSTNTNINHKIHVLTEAQRLGSYFQPDQNDSPYKKMKRTGYFGGTSKITSQNQLGESPKKYNFERLQFIDENISQKDRKQRRNYRIRTEDSPLIQKQQLKSYYSTYFKNHFKELKIQNKSQNFIDIQQFRRTRKLKDVSIDNGKDILSNKKSESSFFTKNNIQKSLLNKFRNNIHNDSYSQLNLSQNKKINSPKSHKSSYSRKTPKSPIQSLKSKNSIINNSYLRNISNKKIGITRNSMSFQENQRENSFQDIVKRVKQKLNQTIKMKQKYQHGKSFSYYLPNQQKDLKSPITKHNNSYTDSSSYLRPQFTKQFINAQSLRNNRQFKRTSKDNGEKSISPASQGFPSKKVWNQNYSKVNLKSPITPQKVPSNYSIVIKSTQNNLNASFKKVKPVQDLKSQKYNGLFVKGSITKTNLASLSPYLNTKLNLQTSSQRQIYNLKTY